jgi:dTDP-4-amino-4,6-dideoxygalactose transaminase
MVLPTLRSGRYIGLDREPLKMIPRIKVNYTLMDLLRASLVSETSEVCRNVLVKRLRELFGLSGVMLSASGRGALYVLLMSLPQKRVLVPAYTCKAVIEAVRLAGKELVFGESEPVGFNMSLAALDDQLDADTVLLATHQFGFPCEIEAMVKCARAVGAFVIEDAAAALGTRVDGRLVGSFGDAAFFSFDSSKLINTALKGGFLLVKDPALQARCEAFLASSTAPMPLARKLRYLVLGAILVLIEWRWLYRLFHNVNFHWRGRVTDEAMAMQAHAGPFYKDRLTEWQAKLLLPQVDRLEQLVVSRRGLYARYLQALTGVRRFELPPEDRLGTWAPIRFPIRVHGDKLQLYHALARRGVDCAFSFTYIACPPEFVRSHRIAESVLDLPFYERLSTAEFERVITVLRDLDSQDLTGT